MESVSKKICKQILFQVDNELHKQAWGQVSTQIWKQLRIKIDEQIRHQVSNQICDEVIRRNKIIWNQ
jgi:hypothetical protein